MENLTLVNIGELNRECSDLFPSLVNSISAPKQKAKLDITIEIERMPDSDTAVVVGYTVKPTYPKKARKILARTDLTGNLKVDGAQQKQLGLTDIIHRETEVVK